MGQWIAALLLLLVAPRSLTAQVVGGVAGLPWVRPFQHPIRGNVAVGHVGRKLLNAGFGQLGKGVDRQLQQADESSPTFEVPDDMLSPPEETAQLPVQEPKATFIGYEEELPPLPLTPSSQPIVVAPTSPPVSLSPSVDSEEDPELAPGIAPRPPSYSDPPLEYQEPPPLFAYYPPEYYGEPPVDSEEPEDYDTFLEECFSLEVVLAASPQLPTSTFLATAQQLVPVGLPAGLLSSTTSPAFFPTSSLTVFVPEDAAWVAFVEGVVLPANVSDEAKAQLLRDIVMGHFVEGAWDAGMLARADELMLLALADVFLEGGLSVFAGCSERIVRVGSQERQAEDDEDDEDDDDDEDGGQPAGNEVSVQLGDTTANISVRNVQTDCPYTIHVVDRVLLPCNITAQLEDIQLQERVTNQTESQPGDVLAPPDVNALPPPRIFGPTAPDYAPTPEESLEPVEENVESSGSRRCAVGFTWSLVLLLLTSAHAVLRVCGL